MIDWLYHLPVIWMAVVVFAATFLVSGAIYAGVMKLATGERARVFKTMSPVMLTAFSRRLRADRCISRDPGLDRCRAS
jgi:Na+/H+-dicarboxylate symporter